MKPQVRKLAETATALRDKTSTYFSITRLTSLKSLCREPTTAAQFVFHLAECTFDKVRDAPGSRYTKPADWQYYQVLIGEGVAVMKKYLRKPTEKNLSALREMWRKVESVQTYTGKEIWGHPIRSIHSRDALVIEDALQCMISPAAAPFWAYQTARDYAEQYNPHYGTGLILESVPMLEDIISFWDSRN